MEASDHLASVLVVLAEFAFLMGLGFIFMRLLYWHSVFDDRRQAWLQACQIGVRQLRILRRQLEKVDGDLGKLPLAPKLRKGLNVMIWAGKAFKVAKAARS